MSILSLGSPKDKGSQLLVRDDESFQIRKLDLEDSCLVEKGVDNLPYRAWKHFYATQLSFKGYKNIPAGSITLSGMRDFILDPFNRAPETETPGEGGKPKQDAEDIRKWTSKIAESKRYQVNNKRPNQMLLDKLTWFLGAGLIIELIIWAISYAARAH